MNEKPKYIVCGSMVTITEGLQLNAKINEFYRQYYKMRKKKSIIFEKKRYEFTKKIKKITGNAKFFMYVIYSKTEIE